MAENRTLRTVRTASGIGVGCLKRKYAQEQIHFTQYRPVLLNTRLKEQFGYTPQRASREAFLSYLYCTEASSAGGRGPAHMPRA